METPEVLITLMLAICLLAMLAERLHISHPILFLLGGIGLAYMPGIQSFAIEPQEILTIFLPPLLMEAAYSTSLRDFRHNLRHIMQLAVGLVLVTAATVAWVFTKMVPDASWATALVLGAIVSPPDAVAATSIIRKMRVPRRIVTILEGESLINDAVGLILYKFAVAAVLTAQFSLVNASGHFVWMVFSSLAIGLAVAKVFLVLFPYLKVLSIEILSTFVVSYTAYMLAETVQSSGVLCVVAAGLYIGWHAPTTFTPRFRLPGEAVWRMVTFVLGALVFILIGLRIPSLFEHLEVYSTGTLLMYAAAVCATAVVVRFVYIFLMGYGVPALFPSIRKRDGYPHWQNVFLVSYTSMRGVVSLATALALPVTISWGLDFPYRDLITFLALSLIVFTLVVQGLFLPMLVRKLTLNFDPQILHEDWNARVTSAREALEKIEALERHSNIHGPALERIKSHYVNRLALLGDGPNTPLYPTEIPNSMSHPLIQEEGLIWREVLAIERKAVVKLRKAYKIGDDVMYDIIRELDLLANRFEHSG